MRPLRILWHRVRGAFRTRRLDRELHDEISAHLEEAIDDYVRQGYSPEDARIAALRSFGGVTRAEDAYRDVRSFVWLDHLRRDVRHAARSLRRSPAFTVVAILTLALGIGAVTALFTVLDGVVLKPLQYPDADRIVQVLNQYADRRGGVLTGADEMDVAAEQGIFDAIAFYQGGEMGVQLADHAEYGGVRLVHPDFFRVFALSPVAGRPFDHDDSERSAVVSLTFAARNFGGAAAALGKTVFIEDRSYEIVGVMPPAMRFPAKDDVWVAMPVLPKNRNRSGHNYRTVAKLATGVSIEQANARLAVLGERLAAAYPDTNKGKSFVAVLLRDNLVSQVRTTLYVLMGAVGLLLLIACANVANLMLARGAARVREVGVRAALGASRRRIVGQLLIESLVLAAIACGVGLLIATFGTQALLRLGERYVPRIGEIAMDWRVLLFSVGVSIATTIVCGLAPAIQASRVSVTDALNQGGTRAILGGRSAGMRSGLVVAQIALSCVLAVNAGLLFRSFVLLTETPLGFQSEGVLVMYAHAPARGSFFDKSGLDNYLRVGRFFDDVLAKLRELPTVIAAGRWVCRPVSTIRTARTRSKAATSSAAIFAACRRPAFVSQVPATSQRWTFPSCAAAISTTAISTTGRTSRSSANRSRSNSSAAKIRWGIA